MRVETQAQGRRRGWCYARVSSAQQAELGVSLEAQEARLRAWCEFNGYEVAAVLVDRGISGSRADNRPALQEALSRVRRGDSLVVYSLSRLARSVKDTLRIAEELERRGVDLVSLSERIDTTNSSGRLSFRMLAVLGEFEREQISERTSMAMAQLRKSGRYCGGFIPYGFRCVDGVLEAVPEEQAVIERVRRLRDAGASYGVIIRKLMEVGLVSRAGKPFEAMQIARMLKASA